MRFPREFEYFIEQGVVKKSKIDNQKASFLVSESETAMHGLDKRLKVMGIDKYNSNSIIKDCYDIIMELIRAKLLLSGYSSSGNYAHEAEVAYLKKLKFDEGEISFLNELRHSRNSITYYGTLLDEEYAKKVVVFINKIYPKLKKLITI